MSGVVAQEQLAVLMDVVEGEEVIEVGFVEVAAGARVLELLDSLREWMVVGHEGVEEAM